MEWLEILIAYCRDPLFDLWYKYDDAIVTEVKDYQNEVINFAILKIGAIQYAIKCPNIPLSPI